MRYTGLIACAALFSSTLAKPGYQDSYDSSSYGGDLGSNNPLSHNYGSSSHGGDSGSDNPLSYNYGSSSHGGDSGSDNPLSHNYGSSSHGGDSGSDNPLSYNYGSSSHGDNSRSSKSTSYSKGYDSHWNGGLEWDKTKSSWSKTTQTIIGHNSTVTKTRTEAFTATEVSVEAVTSTAVSTRLVTKTENGIASTLIIIVNISDGLPAATSIATLATATTTTVKSYITEAALSSTTLSVVTQATAFVPPANTSIALQLNATAPPSPAVFTGSGGKISVDYALTAAGVFALAAFLV